LRRVSNYKDRPATIIAIGHRLSQHSSDERAAASAAAWAGSDAGPFADLLEGLGTRLNCLEHGAFANLIAQTGRLEIFDDGLLSGLSF
jgi:hypothetical protein